MDNLPLEPWPRLKPNPAHPKPDITSAITDLTIRTVEARVAHQTKREARMSKLGAIAERIAAKKEAHDKKADEWAARLDALDRREPDAFAIGDAVIGEREADLTDMESSMRTLSNLPNVLTTSS